MSQVETGKPKNKYGYKYILTMLDEFSKFFMAIPTKDNTASEIVRVLWDRMICTLGRIPRCIVLDNGMDSKELRRFVEDVDPLTQVKPMTPYHPLKNLKTGIGAAKYMGFNGKKGGGGAAQTRHNIATRNKLQAEFLNASGLPISFINEGLHGKDDAEGLGC